MTRANEDRLQAFYSAFEERFRGSFDSIRQRLEYYLPVAKEIHQALQAPALDLGAGRGEWVALLQDAGIPITGVDSNRVAVERARDAGLPVEEGDLMDRLRDTRPASLALISAFHVIEHLPWEAQLDFFRLAARALKPDGLLILEWPNIETPDVAMRTFWLDPTHLRPVPVELIGFMAEFEGFRISHVERLNGGGDIALLAQRQAGAETTDEAGDTAQVAAAVPAAAEATVPPASASSSGDAEHRQSPPVKGMNVIGHVSGNLGLGVFARQVVEALVAAGVPVAIVDIDPGQGRGRHDLRFADLHVADIAALPYEINLFLLPPATMPWLLGSIGPHLRLLDRVNVLWAMWELPVVPEAWRPALRVMDAVLGGSRFVEAAVAFSCDGPLALDAPVPVSLPVPERRQRSDFGLPQDAVLFAAAFEPVSDQQRKNPLAAVRAFLEGAGDVAHAHLLIKVNNPEGGGGLQSLLDLIDGHPRVHLFTESLSYVDTVSLYQCCDVFISLHRAEGLGLVPMEFMALGKPVIATGWSGNMSYMTPDSACLVSYRLIPVDGEMEVYSSGFVGSQVSWADPDVAEAAEWVRTLTGDADLRRRIGERARARMQAYQTLARRCSWLEGLAALQTEHARLPTRRQRKAAALQAMSVSPTVAVKTPVMAAGPDRREWAVETMATDRLPSLGVVVLAPEVYHAQLPRTVAALEAQWLRPAAVAWVGDSDAPSHVQSQLWHRMMDGTVLDSVNRVLTTLAADWVALLHAGDILTDDALFRLATAIGKHPEWQVVYTDEYPVDADGQPAGDPHYKPDFNLDYLRSMPYTGGLMLVRRSFLERLGGFDPTLAGLEEYDLMLRAWELGGDEAIGHVPGALYGRRQQSSYAPRPLNELLAEGRRALAAHLDRLSVDAEVENGPLPTTYRVRYRHAAQPMVSIIIPTRNQQPVLQRCLESLLSQTAYPNYEILIVDNGSSDEDAVEYINGLRALEGELAGRLRIVDYPEAFNFSAMNNRAAAVAQGEYLLLLNNDTAVLHAEWLDEMMAHAQRDDVGVVGAKLLFPDGKIQHAGVLLGVKGPAEHPFIGQDPKSPGYYARLQVDQDYSAVTGACLLVRKALYDEVGGLDAAELAVSYSDIDLCLKIQALGKRVVWTPHAILMHEGSKSQQSGVEQAPDAAKLARFQREQACMYAHWLPQMANDPAYNRNLSLASTDFVAESDPALRWDSAWRPVPRIITQPADRMGCGEYRIIAPTRALIEAGRIQGQETDRIYTPPELARIKPDTLVVQRQVEPFQIEAIERHKRFNPDVLCVFEIDDLVTNVPLKNAHRQHLPKDLYKRLRRAVAACDRLVVATEPLAEAYRDLSDDIRVVPNFIEAATWGRYAPSRRVGAKPRVGWAGGVSHTGDLELIENVVEALGGEVEWVFLGMCPPRIRPYVAEFYAPVPIDEYPAKLASLNLDLAIAPLEDVPFNHAKSHLRLLEYGILGYPVVCTDLTPYQGDFPVTRVRNRFKDWVEAIRAHLADLDAAAEAGDRLRQHIRSHWLLEDNLDAWLDAWLP